jgi:hypothetical protein
MALAACLCWWEDFRNGEDVNGPAADILIPDPGDGIVEYASAIGGGAVEGDVRTLATVALDETSLGPVRPLERRLKPLIDTSPVSFRTRVVSATSPAGALHSVRRGAGHRRAWYDPRSPIHAFGGG